MTHAQQLINHIVANGTCQGEIEAALAFDISGIIDGLDKAWLESDAGQTVLAELNLAWPLYDTELTAPPQPQSGFLEVEQHAVDAEVDAIPFWQQFKNITEAEIEAHDQEKHDDRRDHCRLRRGWIMDPVSLTWKSYLHKCGYWRGQECPHCFGDRKREFKNRITVAIKTPGITVYVLSANDPLVPELKKELESTDYLRLPTNGEDGGLFFYNASKREKLGQHVLSVNQIDEDKWDEVTDTPKGSRPSGHLGKPEEEEEEEKTEENGYVEIETREFGVSVNHDQTVNTLWKEAVATYNEQAGKAGTHVLESIEDLNKRTTTTFAIFLTLVKKHNENEEDKHNWIDLLYQRESTVWVSVKKLSNIIALFSKILQDEEPEEDIKPPF